MSFCLHFVCGAILIQIFVMKKYFDSFFEKICILLFIRIFQNIFTAVFGGCAVICASHVIGHFVRYKLSVIGAAPLLGTSCVISCALLGLRRYLCFARY